MKDRPLSGALKAAAVAMAAIVVPWIVVPWVQSTLLGSCEGFGCAGGLAFALPVSLIGGAIAAVAAGLVYRWTIRRGAAHRPLARVLVASLLLAPLLRSVPRWPLPDYALPIAWLVACGLVYALALRLFVPRH